MTLDSNEEKDVVITSDTLEIENCFGIQNRGTMPIILSHQDFSDTNSGYVLGKNDVFIFGEGKTIYVKAPQQATTVHLQGGE